MTYAFLPVIAAGSIALFVLAAGRISKAAQPLRLELAEKGEALLSEKELPEVASVQVRFMLDSAFGLRGPLLYGIFAAPFFSGALTFRQRAANAVRRISDPAMKAAFAEVAELHERLTFANNPILMAVLNAEMAILIRRNTGECRLR